MPFLNHNDKLAFTTGWYVQSDRPVRDRVIHVSKIAATDWSVLLDNYNITKIDWLGNEGVVYLLNRSPVRLDTTDWESITEEQPIKKPRRGKRKGQAYDWEWNWGKWVRKWL